MQASEVPRAPKPSKAPKQLHRSMPPEQLATVLASLALVLVAVALGLSIAASVQHSDNSQKIDELQRASREQGGSIETLSRFVQAVETGKTSTTFPARSATIPAGAFSLVTTEGYIKPITGLGVETSAGSVNINVPVIRTVTAEGTGLSVDATTDPNNPTLKLITEFTAIVTNLAPANPAAYTFATVADAFAAGRAARVLVQGSVTETQSITWAAGTGVNVEVTVDGGSTLDLTSVVWTGPGGGGGAQSSLSVLGLGVVDSALQWTSGTGPAAGVVGFSELVLQDLTLNLAFAGGTVARSLAANSRVSVQRCQLSTLTEAHLQLEAPTVEVTDLEALGGTATTRLIVRGVTARCRLEDVHNVTSCEVAGYAGALAVEDLTCSADLTLGAAAGAVSPATTLALHRCVVGGALTVPALGVVDAGEVRVTGALTVAAGAGALGGTWRDVTVGGALSVQGPLSDWTLVTSAVGGAAALGVGGTPLTRVTLSGVAFGGEVTGNGVVDTVTVRGCFFRDTLTLAGTGTGVSVTQCRFKNTTSNPVATKYLLIGPGTTAVPPTTVSHVVRYNSFEGPYSMTLNGGTLEVSDNLMAQDGVISLRFSLNARCNGNAASSILMTARAYAISDLTVVGNQLLASDPARVPLVGIRVLVDAPLPAAPLELTDCTIDGNVPGRYDPASPPDFQLQVGVDVATTEVILTRCSFSSNECNALALQTSSLDTVRVDDNRCWTGLDVRYRALTLSPGPAVLQFLSVSGNLLQNGNLQVYTGSGFPAQLPNVFNWTIARNTVRGGNLVFGPDDAASPAFNYMARMRFDQNSVQNAYVLRHQSNAPLLQDFSYSENVLSGNTYFGPGNYQTGTIQANVAPGRMIDFFDTPTPGASYLVQDCNFTDNVLGPTGSIRCTGTLTINKTVFTGNTLGSIIVSSGTTLTASELSVSGNFMQISLFISGTAFTTTALNVAGNCLNGSMTIGGTTGTLSRSTIAGNTLRQGITLNTSADECKANTISGNNAETLTVNPALTTDQGNFVTGNIFKTAITGFTTTETQIGTTAANRIVP